MIWHTHRALVCSALTLIAIPGLVMTIGCSETTATSGDAAAAGRDAGTRPRMRTDECGNGVDDDGNGRIDDSCPCAPGEMQACFGGATASRRIGSCRDGMQVCAVAPGGEWGDWGDFPCTGDTRPMTEMCDGADHDCDGARDEDCPCTEGDSRECGVEFLLAPCTGGVQSCRVGRWGVCEGAVSPSPDVCGDGIDNDCDGMRDELCSCVPEPEVCGDGVDNDCDGAADEGACLPDLPPPPGADAGVALGVDAGAVREFDAGVVVPGCTCTEGSDVAFSTIAIEDAIPMTASVMRGRFAAASHLRGDDQLGMILTQSTGTGTIATQLQTLDVEGATRSGLVPSPWPGAERGIATPLEGIEPTPYGYIVSAGGDPVTREPLSWRRIGRDMATIAPFEPDSYATPTALADPVHPSPSIRGMRFIDTPVGALAVWLECRAWTTHMSGFFSSAECTDPAIMQQRVGADLAPIAPAERLGEGMTSGLVWLTRVFWSGTHLIVAGRQNTWTPEQHVGVSLLAFAGTTLVNRHDGPVQLGDALTTSDVAVVADRMLHCYRMWGASPVHPLTCHMLGLDGTEVMAPLAAGLVVSELHPNGGVMVVNAGCSFVVVAYRRVSTTIYTTMPSWFSVDPATGAMSPDHDLYPRGTVIEPSVLAAFDHGPTGARIITEQFARLATPPRPPEDPYVYFLQRRTLASRDVICE